MTSYPNRSRGLTLIELMVVVVIVGILAAVAYPSYRQQVIRSNRTEAKVELMQLAGRLEKCYTRWHAYDAAGCALVAPALTNYDIDLDGIEESTYTLVAIPKGGQTADAKCGNLSLTETGDQMESGTGTPKDCW